MGLGNDAHMGQPCLELPLPCENLCWGGWGGTATGTHGRHRLKKDGNTGIHAGDNGTEAIEIGRVGGLGDNHFAKDFDGGAISQAQKRFMG